MVNWRPFWGLIIWLYFCVIIWVITEQVPVLSPESENGVSIGIGSSGIATAEKIQQTGHGKHLLEVRRSINNNSTEILYNALGADGQTQQQQQQQTTTLTSSSSNSSRRYKYQIYETSRHYNSSSKNKNKINNNNNISYSNSISNLLLEDAEQTKSHSSTGSGSAEPAVLDVNVYAGTPKPMRATPAPLLSEDERQLIDLHNFNYLIQQKPCDAKVQVLILVHTAPRNLEKRQLIRQTWGSAGILQNTPLRLLFLLGAVVPQTTLQHALEQENTEYGDMVQGSFMDDYRNMTYKHVMALKWFHYHCTHAQLLIKVDDDVYVNTLQLLKYLNNVPELKTTTAFTANLTAETAAAVGIPLRQLLLQQPRELLFCERFIGARVKRSYRSKWRVSFDEYAERYYPPYCPGYAIIYSKDIVSRLYKAAQQSRYFWIDDVMITGVLAQRTNTTITQLHPYVLFSDECEQLLKGKTDLNKIEFLFSWHSISQEQIRALWLLHMNNNNNNENNVAVTFAVNNTLSSDVATLQQQPQPQQQQQQTQQQQQELLTTR